MSGDQNTIQNTSADLIVQANNFYGGIGPASHKRPEHLDSVARHFTDRHDERERLEAFRREPGGEGHVKVVVIHGMPGVGKTALAVKWLNEIAAEYEGGHLQIDFGGSRVSGTESADALLAHALIELGRAPDTIPAETGAKKAVFRSLTRDRSIILLLDDVANVGQVRAFLPATATALVVITCTVRLPRHAVPGAGMFRLGPMQSDAIERFLIKALLEEDPGPGYEEEKANGNIRRLAERCHGHPLLAHMAVTALDNELFLKPGELADAFELVEWDEDRGDPEMGERSFPAELQVFVDRLSEEAASAYPYSGLHPVGAFDRWAIAALLGADLATAERALSDLYKNGLVHQIGDRAEGRFGMDEAVRSHARRAADLALDTRATSAAERRCAHYYTAAVLEAGERVTRRWSVADKERVRALSQGDPAPATPPLSDAGAAADWMDANLDAVLAVARRCADLGDHDPVWMITEGADGYLRERGRHTDRQELMRLGIEAARKAGNTAAEARIRNQYGIALVDEGRVAKAEARVAEAREQFGAALALSERDDDGRGQGAAWECLGIAAQRADDHREALRCFDRAEPFKRAMNRPQAMAVLGMLRGRSLAALGRFGEALDVLAPALVVFEDDSEGQGADTVNVAKTRLEQGVALSGLGRNDEALRELRSSLADFGRRRHVLQQARVHEALADVVRSRPSDRWPEHLRAAADLYRGMGDDEAAGRVEARLPHDGAGPEDADEG